MKRRSVFAAMKNVACVLLIFTLTCTMALTLMTFQVYGSDPTVKLDPSSYYFNLSNASIGTRFNVTLKVDDVTDLAVYEWSIGYNDTIINVTRWYEPTWDPTYVFYGRTTLPAPYPDPAYDHIAPDTGKATSGGGLMPPPPTQSSFTGDGTLCLVEFEILAVPAEGETLSCDLILNYEEFFLLDSPGDEIPNVTKPNGYYEIIPEFSSLLMVLLFIGITIIAIVFNKKIFRNPRFTQDN